jgi:integrase
MPLRKPNAELRTREYLTDAETKRLTEAAKDNRYGHRDATMILMAYRHGFRAIELVDLRWDQIDFLHQQGLDTTTTAGQGDVSNARRVCRVRARDHSRTSQCQTRARQGER